MKKTIEKTTINKIAIVISDDKESVYQVLLTEQQTETIMDLLKVLHKGKIKCFDKKLDLKLGGKRE
ncbi:MAG TPA: hypothetical protein ENK99_07745 [Campylobacterales bacterium]|nr:hypothetical protein [Campylobacterales bacterium]